MLITFRERFFGLPNPMGGIYAPSTIGAPEFLYVIDSNVWKKTATEKLDVKMIRLDHKRDLKIAYPAGVGRNLNVPNRTLEKIIVSF